MSITTRPTDRQRAILIMTLAGALAACQTETGILVAVSGSDVDQLEFQVGVRQPDDRFVLDQEISGTLEDTRGRDLRANPFLLMLKEEPDAVEPPTVRVLALGYRITPEGRELYGLDVTDPPQPFVLDEVVRRNLELTRVGDHDWVREVGAGCLRARTDDTTFRWLHQDDMDCDGYSPGATPADCDDADDTIHPEARELCDGKDNDCDDQLSPPFLDCYARGGEPNVCRRGQRACDEAAGGGLGDTCEVDPTSPRVAEAYCDAYARCEGLDPLGCADREVDPETLTCTVEAKDKTVCPGGTIELHPLLETESCRWEIVESSGLQFGLVSGVGQPTATVKDCHPILDVRGDPPSTSGRAVLELFDLAEQRSAVLEIQVTGQAMTSCGPEPLQCE